MRHSAPRDSESDERRIETSRDRRHSLIDDRAVSTVVDVSLALLLISASIFVIGTYLQADTDRYEPETADQTAETIAATTVSVGYSLENVRDEPEFPAAEFSENFDDPITDDDLRRVSHGPAAGHLADAAVTNVEFDEVPLTVEGETFEESVIGALQATLVGSADQTHVVATWEPYDGAFLSGSVSTNRTPPPDADVSVSTMTVPSTFEPIPDEKVRAASRSGGRTGFANVVAGAIVDGYLPREQSQHALESQGVDRAVTVYRYQRFAAVLGEDVDFGDPTDDESSISRLGANASAANEELEAALVSQIVADLSPAADEQLDRKMWEQTERWATSEITEEEWYRIVAELFVDVVAIDEVQLTVYTWDQ